MYKGYKNKFESKGVTLYQDDCMNILKQTPDNYYDLCIVDPPYQLNRFKNGIKKGDRMSNNLTGESTHWNNGESSPDFFNQLFRVSKNQIVWGANNFAMPPSEYFCIWNKMQTVDNFATAEYAWVSMGLKKPAKMFNYSIHQHNADEKKCKIHPTQKPVKLYEWMLSTYAKPEMKILDTHLGSGSSAIAAHYFGCDFVGIELDKDYFDAAKKRFEQQTAQLDMF